MWTDSLFPVILDRSLAATVVILAVLLLRWILKKYPRRQTILLWAVVLFRLLCPILPESDLSLIPLAITSGAQETALPSAYSDRITTANAAMAAYHAVGDTLNGGIDTIIIPMERAADTDSTDTPLSADPSVPADPSISTDTGEPAEESVSAPLPTIYAYHDQVWVLFFGRLWLPVGAALFLYSMVGYFRLKKRVSVSVPFTVTENLTPRVSAPVFLADSITNAFVLGILRPNIYLPSALSPDDRRYLLAHERVHIRYGDHILKFLAFCALCVHWFNPLVWAAFILSARDMEERCDETATALLSDTDGQDISADYADALLRLSVQNRHTSLFTVPGFGETAAKKRIVRILSRTSTPFRQKTGVLCVLLCILMTLVCACDPAGGIRADAANIQRVTLDGREISAERGAALADLINQYDKSVNRTYDGIADTPVDHTVMLTTTDNGTYVVYYQYVSGYSFHPLHTGEDDYLTVVSHIRADGKHTGSWVMEYDFDNAFLEWLEEDTVPFVTVKCGGTETVITPAAVRYDSHVDYEAIPTVTAVEDAEIMITDIQSETLIISEDYYEALGADSTTIRRNTETISANSASDAPCFLFSVTHRHPRWDESAVYYLAAPNCRYVFRLQFLAEP